MILSYGYIVLVDDEDLVLFQSSNIVPIVAPRPPCLMQWQAGSF